MSFGDFCQRIYLLAYCFARMLRFKKSRVACFAPCLRIKNRSDRIYSSQVDTFGCGLTGSVILLAGLLLGSTSAWAERISDIRNTKHNFSATVIPDLPDAANREAFASSESQICAFCHTPHGGTNEPQAPIWNRQLSTATYTPYTSTSLDAIDLGQPGGKSKLCLSCHDGTLALGSVNVLNREEQARVDFTGPGVAGDGSIPHGEGAESGFTRRLGVDLTNDHPISFTYDSAQAERDGELYDPNVVGHIGDRQRDQDKPTLPLENNKVECITCHDPHIRDTSGENIKFLRANRFQTAPPVDGQFDEENDIICLGCHDKAGWVGSAHANSSVASYRYQDAAADLREFPRDMQVWQAACLNCHDPHTVQGSRRLLREGVDSSVGITAGGARFKLGGGSAAIEETCYTCHSADGEVLQGQSVRPGFGVPDVKTDFTTVGNRHMPIATVDQANAREIHSIGSAGLHQGGKDFVEAPANMGKASKVNKDGEQGSLLNRHAECTDCHNPHRVSRNRLFWQDNTIPGEEGTHNHTAADIATNPEGYHTNIASGVLRGIFGVEPVAWESTEFGAKPTVFEVKRGDAGTGASTDVSAPYVTREYQVCMKCHSNYAYDTAPALGSFSGGTPSGISGVTAKGAEVMTHYTNQGMEFQSPPEHKGEGTAPTPSGAFRGLLPGGAGADFQANNHRSWHPVMDNTGRTPSVRGINGPDVWLTPFNAAVGLQTMYCTDCHGNDTEPGTAVPTPASDVNGNVWGPHGSTNDFLLKGPWSDQTGSNREDDLCFKCHDYNQYGKIFGPGNLPAGPSPVGALDSGFKRVLTGSPSSCIGTAVEVNAHLAHGQFLGTQPGMSPLRCTYCHVAIPHGWKNKVFLVNLNDVGPEGGLPSGTQVRNKTEARYYKYPYYNGAVLKVKSFARSGEWLDTNCGSSGPPGNGVVGSNWMRGSGGSSEACTNPP